MIREHCRRAGQANMILILKEHEETESCNALLKENGRFKAQKSPQIVTGHSQSKRQGLLNGLSDNGWALDMISRTKDTPPELEFVQIFILDMF